MESGRETVSGQTQECIVPRRVADALSEWRNGGQVTTIVVTTPSQERWDLRFLDFARYFALKTSKDPSTKVGALIANRSGQMIFGYNGFPRGVEDSEERYNDRDLKYKIVVHAELNAILNAAGRLPSDATLYTWPLPPCERCAGAIIQAGVKRVVSVKVTNERWKDSFKLADLLFKEAGVVKILYPEEMLGDST